jgi:hypothetical protein
VCIVINAFSTLREGLAQGFAGSRSRGQWRQVNKLTRFLVGLVLFVFALMIVASIIGAPIFNAGRYQRLITIEEGNFTEDVAELSMSNIPVVDRDTAVQLGKRKLGEISDLVSQFEIQSNYTQINYHNSPYRVTPLAYGDIIKWINNQREGLPAYIMVNMVTQEATLVRLEEGMKYSPSEYFMRNINRHLRFKYPTKIFDTISFEIDEEGTPYWVAPTIKYRIGIWSGKDIGGAILCNAITGESQYYSMDELPAWVDQVVISELIIGQLNYSGKYISGFFNSIFGQKGVLQTTEGYNYIAVGDDVYLYTGMTSVTSDESNVGFVLVNMRTKETKFYSIPGAEEYSAMESAQGQVQHLRYSATFPILLNVSDRPTYFMSLKDSAGLVKMYAFVDVQQYQVVGTGPTVNEARADYISKLKNEDINIGSSGGEEITGKVGTISSAVIDGNTRFYFMLDGDTHVYTADISVSERLPFLREGDNVTFSFIEINDNLREVSEMN